MRAFLLICDFIPLAAVAVYSYYYFWKAPLYRGPLTAAWIPWLILQALATAFLIAQFCFAAFPRWPFSLTFSCSCVVMAINSYLRYRQFRRDPRRDV